MDNFFIMQAPFAKPRKSKIADAINWGINKLGYGYKLERLPDVNIDMNSVEQRMNYFLLLEGLIANGIEGDVAELGCYTGQCALLFEKIIEQFNSQKKLHLYDNFETKFTFTGDVEKELLKNFELANLRAPTLHKGYFQETLPTQLPEKLCFVHIDCGFGGDLQEHKNVMLYCLEQLYPKLTKGAICMLMDYHNEDDGRPGFSVNPGVKLACDVFLKDKPEKMVSLYANEHCHGFFRKL